MGRRMCSNRGEKYDEVGLPFRSKKHCLCDSEALLHLRTIENIGKMLIFILAKMSANNFLYMCYFVCI